MLTYHRLVFIKLLRKIMFLEEMKPDIEKKGRKSCALPSSIILVIDLSCFW